MTCDHHSSSAQMRPGPLARFRRDEGGGMIIFALFIFVLMLMAGGMAVDFMRFENTRTKLQGTLDRALLAAADMDQPLPPAEVVKDYFAKAGMSQFLDGEPIVEEGINYRRVSASASVHMTMMFSDLIGVFVPDAVLPYRRTISVPASGTAEEMADNIEVSLILDVSGSMRNNRRFPNMQAAAYDFIDTIMQTNGGGSEGLVTMSIIPYGSYVNLGPDVAPYYNIDRLHNYSNCIRLPDSIFNDTFVPLDGYGPLGTTPYTQVTHFEQNWHNTRAAPLYQPVCFAGETNAAILHSSSAEDLKQMVENLVPYGTTAIDLGMKWGTTFLDPRSRPVIDGMIDAGDAASEVRGRPLDLGGSETLKVIVLMTDGTNTQEDDIDGSRKTDLSPIWFARADATQSIRDVDRRNISIMIKGDKTPDDLTDDEFFWLGQSGGNRIHAYPKGYPDYATLGTSIVRTGLGEGVAYPDHVYNASWQDIYASWSRRYITSDFFLEPYQRGAISYWTYIGAEKATRAIVNSNEADDRLSDICREARDANIVVYTIAFEAPRGGQDALWDCAGSDQYYYTARGTDIVSVFSTIAANIRRLKLTQ